MALSDDLAVAKTQVETLQAILFMNTLQSFKVEGIDLVILKSQLPQVLIDKIRNDGNAAIILLKSTVASMNNPFD